MDFIIQNLSTIIIILILVALTAFIIARKIIKTKKGESGCSCGCSNCSSSCSKKSIDK